MQIYTKIFIGMALGIVVGLLVGPRSRLLDRDVILLHDSSKLELLDGPGGRAIGLRLPSLAAKDGKSPKLRLELLDAKRVGDRLYREVIVEVTARLALKDASGRLTKGQQLRGWVDAGRVPAPVSSLGVAIVDTVEPVGTAFLRLIMMVIVPLVFASLLVGIASLGDPRKLGRLGGKTLGYFLLTTMAAISIGLLLANTIRPGDYISPEEKQQLVAEYSAAAQAKTSAAATTRSAVDQLLHIIPLNPVKSMASGEMLQIIFFAIFLGVALTLLPERRAAPVIAVFESINDAMVKIVELVMKLAPYGVFALVAKVSGQSGLGVLKALAVYSLVVIVGLALQALGVYTAVVRFVGKVRMIDFWRGIRQAQLIAFSTSSSSATLPVTMKCAERNLGISNRIASFVLPIGSTVNMDGTALYQGVATVFIAQVFDIKLSILDQLNIVLTATLASIGAAGVPGVGMVTLALVLTAIRVPTVGVALILGVDRILDMFRTAVNVTGDMSATVLVAATEGERVRYISPAEAARESASDSERDQSEASEEAERDR